MRLYTLAKCLKLHSKRVKLLFAVSCDLISVILVIKV